MILWEYMDQKGNSANSCLSLSRLSYHVQWWWRVWAELKKIYTSRYVPKKENLSNNERSIFNLFDKIDNNFSSNFMIKEITWEALLLK